MNAWCLHMRGSDELENKKVLPLLRLPAAFPGHTIPLSCFRCHRVLPIRSNEERERKMEEREKKKNRKVHSPILSLVRTKPQKCFHRSRSERAWNGTRRSRLKRSISKATFHRYLSLTQPPTFRIRGDRPI